MQEGGGKILPYTAPSGDEPNASQGTAGEDTNLLQILGKHTLDKF